MKTPLSVILILFCLLSLGGCFPFTPAPKSWYKSGMSNDQMRRDMMTCRQYGMQSAQSHGVAGNMFVEGWIQQEANECMTNLGYSPRSY